MVLLCNLSVCKYLHICVTGLAVAGCHGPQPVGLGGEQQCLAGLEQQLTGLWAQHAGEALPHAQRAQLRGEGSGGRRREEEEKEENRF